MRTTMAFQPENGILSEVSACHIHMPEFSISDSPMNLGTQL